MATTTTAVQSNQTVVLFFDRLPNYWGVEWFGGSNRFSFYADIPVEMLSIIAVCKEIAFKRTKDVTKNKSVKSRMESVKEITIGPSQLGFKHNPPLFNSETYTQVLRYDGVDYEVGKVSITPGPDDYAVEALVVPDNSTLHVPTKSWFDDAEGVEIILEAPGEGASLVFVKRCVDPVINGYVTMDSKGRVYRKSC